MQLQNLRKTSQECQKNSSIPTDYIPSKHLLLTSVEYLIAILIERPSSDFVFED